MDSCNCQNLNVRELTKFKEKCKFVAFIYFYLQVLVTLFWGISQLVDKVTVYTSADQEN